MKWLHNRKVWQKLLILGFLFTLPFGTIVFYEIAFIRAPRDLGQVREQIAAVEIQTRLLHLLHDLQTYRDLGHGLLNNNETLRTDFDLQVTTLRAGLGKTTDTLRTHARQLDLQPEWEPLHAQIETILKRETYARPAEAFTNRTAGIELTRTLFNLISDRTPSSGETAGARVNLTEAFQYHGTPLLAALADARAIGNGITSRPQLGVTDTQEQEFRLLKASLEPLTNALTRSDTTLLAAVERVMRDRPELKPRLEMETKLARAALEDAVKEITKLIPTTAGPNPSPTTLKYHQTLTTATTAILRLEDKVADSLIALLKARADNFYVDVGRILALVALTSLVAIIFAVLIGRTITEPLNEVVEIADQIAEGDLSVRVAVLDRSDEMGNLTRALRRMVMSLNDIVGQVQKSGLQVNTSVSQISVTGKEQQATASNIATTTTQIGATAHDISATSVELVAMMRDATGLAEATATLAGKGQEGLARMGDTMTQLTGAATLIQAKLAVLNEKAANINQVVTAITKIADRTNLLSLNAAIEAEKAGEYGRGFSVVATEIRRLADQTAVATYDIEQMVKEMQTAVSAGTLGMNQTAQDIRQGVHEVQTVGAQLAQVIQQVQALAPRFELVNSGMQSQSAGGQQISEALTQLSNSVQQTAQSLEHSNQAIEQLKSTAYSLREGVARFKLPGHR